MTRTGPTDLVHADGCAREELESFESSRPVDGARVTETRCVGCGASLLLAPPAPPRLEPGSDEWRAAWKLQPSRLVAELEPGEVDNPLLNPRHVLATSWPPGSPPPRVRARARVSWPAFPPVRAR